MKTNKDAVGKIHISEAQLQHISELIDSVLVSVGRSPEFAEYLRALKVEIDRAVIVPQEELPLDVVKVGSFVEVEDLADGYVEQFQLVYPEHADLALGRISLMTPMGIALIGCREGETVEYRAPSGPHRIRIRRVAEEAFNPEAFQRRPEPPQMDDIE